MTPTGICVIVGGALSQVIKTVLFGSFLSFGGRKMYCLNATPDKDDLEYILNLAEEGKIKPVIDRRYPLHKASEALRYINCGHVLGKVIIDVALRESNKQ